MTYLRRALCLAWFGILCAIPAPGLGADLEPDPGPPPAHAWHLPGEIRPLEVRPSLVAVEGENLPSAVDSEVGTLIRLPRDPALGRGRWLFRVPGESRANTVQASRRLARMEGVAWASPFYLDGTTELLVAGQIVVKLLPEADPAELAAGVGLEVLEKFASDQWILTSEFRDAPSLIHAASLLNESNLVVWAEPDFLFRVAPRYTPNDPTYSLQWHLNNRSQLGGTPDVDVNAPEGWDLTPPETRLGGPEVVIAIIDGGVGNDHEDLMENLWTNPGEIPGNGTDDDGNGFLDDSWGWDFSDSGPDNDPSPSGACDDHGVSVAGVAAARGDNGLGV